MATIANPGSDHLDRGALDARIVTDIVLVLSWVGLSAVASFNLLGYSRDYFEYLVYYESIPATLSFDDTRFEPGFHLIAWFFRQALSVRLEALLLFVTSLSLAIKLSLFRKYLKHPLLALAFYSVLFYPIQEYTQYRVALSLAFAYWGAHHILQREFRYAFILFAVAICMHYSSLLLLFVSLGGIMVKGQKAVIMILVGVVVGGMVLGEVYYLLQDVLSILNPLSASYLDNKAMLEGTSLLSINNLLLITALACAVGYYKRGPYSSFFLTISIASLVPIALLPDSPVIAQRSKEVLFVGVIFLMFRSQIGFRDMAALAFFTAMTGLLGYLWIEGGIIFI